jgi:hypothetical protein
MRIYDHYRFRWAAKQDQLPKTGSGKKSQPLHLTPDDSWTNRYFEKESLHWRDRLRFVDGPIDSGV